jgi:hypothetical protein
MNQLAGITGALILGVSGAAIALPAEADHGGENYMNALCNSDYSDSSIRAYSNYPGATYSYTLKAGQCVSRPWNGADNLKVDVETGLSLDIDSYKIGEINVGWGPCHENSENEASDPSDHYNDNGTRYRTSTSSNCSPT